MGDATEDSGGQSNSMTGQRSAVAASASAVSSTSVVAALAATSSAKLVLGRLLEMIDACHITRLYVRL